MEEEQAERRQSQEMAIRMSEEQARRFRIIREERQVRLGYCFTPYQRLWLYNGAPLVAFYDTLGIRRTSSRLKPPASSRGEERQEEIRRAEGGKTRDGWKKAEGRE